MRVLAVDADQQADLTRYARGPRLAGMGLDAVLADPLASLDPRPYIGPVSDNLDLLGSSPRLADVDPVLRSAEGGLRPAFPAPAGGPVRRPRRRGTTWSAIPRCTPPRRSA